MHKVITSPDIEPVSLAEARLQLKLASDNTRYDAMLQGLIVTAREEVEHGAERSLAPQVLEMGFPSFPRHCGGILLEMPPVTAVTWIKYTDEQGVEQTLDPAAYYLSPYGDARSVTLRMGRTWPATAREADAVRVRYSAGTQAPKSAKQAMLLTLELHSPFNALSSAEAENKTRARDALMNVAKVYGI